MALGIPTIASAIGANHRVIEDGISGTLVNTDADWKKALENYILNPDLRKAHGIKARERVEALYSILGNEPYLEVINKVIDSNEAYFATHNANKTAEIQQLLGDDFELLSLEDLSYHQDIPETANTLEGNSKIKADVVYDYFILPCFADDTGLEVESLGGEPGVFSARYAGEEKNAQKNMDLLLNKLEGINNRRGKVFER